MSSNQHMYTHEQLEIQLLKQKNEDIYRILNKLETNVSSNFHWMLGLICGLYAIGITSFLGSIFKLF